MSSTSLNNPRANRTSAHAFITKLLASANVTSRPLFSNSIVLIIIVTTARIVGIHVVKKRARPRSWRPSWSRFVKGRRALTPMTMVVEKTEIMQARVAPTETVDLTESMPNNSKKRCEFVM